MSLILPICPTDCTSTLPVVSFSECAPETNNAQVLYLYMANPGFPMTDWTSPSEWATRISNTSSNSNAIRQISVIGSKPRPEATEKKISHGRIIKGKKNHTLALKVDETNNINYNSLVRDLECGGSKQIWYETETKLYGGNDGIEATVTFDHVIDEDETNLMLFEGEAKWSSQYHPQVINTPIVH